MNYKIIFVLALLFVTACTTSVTNENNAEIPGAQQKDMDKEDNTVPESNQESIDWMNFELYDVNSKTNYKISDFKGKTILIEFFECATYGICCRHFND